MTAQLLASELGNLIQDSKRKNTELRSAAEKTLQDLKALPLTSEAQLAADLSRRSNFISPFLIACGTRNAKYASTGVSCLQRLSVARALPRERLTEVLEAFRDSVSLNITEIQLKILQALPSLLQNYAADIRGDLLFNALQICSALQNTKNFAVSNTAAATLQQLVISVYDRVASEDERVLEIPTSAEVTGNGGSISVRPAAHDAYKVFNDLNLLVTGNKTEYVRFSSLTPTSTLELIEAILSNHGKIMTTHLEQIHILRSLLMPLIIRSLSERLSFPITLRIIRILNLLIRNHLSILPSECEIALGLLNHMLDPEASPVWKRALCLEVFRGIYSDSRLVLDIYSHFDEQEGKKCIFGDNLAAFVRLATEKPAVIGLGQQSTVPVNRGEGKESEQAVAEAGALAGVIGGPVSESSAGGHPIGISMQWSSMKTPCIEHLDKTDPPALPETYVYSLVLTCITNVSETLAKFVLPLTVHHESRSKRKNRAEEPSKADSDAASSAPSNQRLSRSQSFRKKSIPVNPLDLADHPAYSYIQTTTKLVTECWYAVLATCSTFLHAALDDDYYRALVRAIQKFTQVAGLLRLSTPRDALLTTLGKAAVPAATLHANIASPKTPTPESPGIFSNPRGLLSVDSLVSQASSMSGDNNRRPSHDVSAPTLGPRNLLCLRALLNLAIALGPTLQSAWSIIFETLQVADLVLSMSNHQGGLRTPGTPRGRMDTDQSSEKFEAETAAVQAAARRLFESTVDFPNDSFVELLQALCSLLNTASPPESGQRTPTGSSARPQILQQRRMGSVAGMSLSTDSNARDSMFALNKIGELAVLNEGRLSQYDPAESGWNVFITELVRFSTDDLKAASARLLAADIVSRTVKEIAELSMEDDEQRNEIQTRILSALQTQISALHQNDRDGDFYDDTDIRIHQVALEALKSVIEQCGESLVAGWDSVFDSLLSVFSTRESAHADAGQDINTPSEHEPQARVISKPLARSAFGSVQLVCSDFLAAVPDKSLATLLDILLRFCCQQEDFNMSLTTITFFWNVSDFLHSRSDLSMLPDLLGDAKQRGEINRIVTQHSQAGSMPTLWLQVLLNLSTVTTDKRAELRNSAIQTIQRIFENYADQLSPSTWMICLRTVLFALLESNISVHVSIRNGNSVSADEIAAWNETTKTALGSIGILLATYMESVEDANGVSSAWSDLLDYFREYFRCGSHALGCSVFNTMTTVLSRAESAKLLKPAPLHKTAIVWKSYFDNREAWEPRTGGNQEAFVAYAEAFKSVYRLSQKNLDSELPSMLPNLEACVVISDDIAYSSDVDHMTPLQTKVIECLSLLNSDSAGLPTLLIEMLSRFITLPYDSAAAYPEKRGPTFVALSKASMTLLQSIAIKHINEQDIYNSGAFTSALSALAKPIQEKYIWQREGKTPTLWQKATTTALAILQPGLSYLTSHSPSPSTTKSIWTQIVNIANGITAAQIDAAHPPPSVEKDEAFDIASFSTLRDMITVSLGSPVLPDSLRRAYTRHLFETSIIHSPAPGEIPNLATAPLQDIYKIRFGQTKTPEPVARMEMAYFCFRELASLVEVSPSASTSTSTSTTKDMSTSHTRLALARAAAPYLILRSALPIRSYISDDPLRGHMPAPEPQTRELLFTLQLLSTLKSEPKAIPDAPGVKSRYRKHLHRLYPLLVRALGVARGSVFEGLVGLVGVVGGEFGVEGVGGEDEEEDEEDEDEEEDEEAEEDEEEDGL